MGNLEVNYRAVHVKTGWRKVKGHESINNALYGSKDGAVGLFAGRVRINYERHGAPLYVVVWEDEGQCGFVVKPDVSAIGGIAKRSVSVEYLISYDKMGGATISELESYFTVNMVEPISEEIRSQECASVPASKVSANEGELVLRKHLERERVGALVWAKKEAVLLATGRLQCEACNFDFAEVYGELGNGFCEVHHVNPLGQRTRSEKTLLEDLAILCSNCHSFIHRTNPMWTVSKLSAHLTRAHEKLRR